MRFHPAHPDFNRSIFNSVLHDPMTALMVAVGTQAVSAISQGNQQAAQYKAQAQAANYNAQVQEDNAARVAREASIREDNVRRQNAQFLGRQRASFAQSDTGLGTGSSLDVMTEDTQQAELDALTTRYEGDTQRAGLLSEANMSRYQAGVASSNASSARTSGYLGAVVGAAGRYYDYTQTRTPSSSALGNRMPWQMPGMVAPGGGKYV